MKTTFLAGDVLKDGQINQYDKSYVNSYFGETCSDKTKIWSYVKYDLNRDGNVDSRDSAIVLVSYGY